MQQLRAFFLCLLIGSGLAANAQGHNVRLLCNWTDTTLVPVNANGLRYNEVWGFIAQGREYAVIGSSVGAHVIDVQSCRQVAYAPGRTGNATHRDYKTYRHYLYASSEDGQSSLQIFDTRYLPDSLHLVYESDPRDFSRTHKLFIDTVTARLYCPTFSNTGGANDFMRVYSLAKPDAPSLLTIYNSNGAVHDVYVRNDTAFCSSSFAGYHVVDCSRPPAATLITQLTNYPYKGFNHSSWIGSDGIGVMADEGFGLPLKVIDTRNLRRIIVRSTFGPRGADTTSVPHNPYMRGHFAFISYYQDGLQIYDLKDPDHPVQAGYYHTYTKPYTQSYGGAWGCYPFLPSRKVLVSDMHTGLYVLDADEATGTEKGSNFGVFPNPATDHISLLLPYSFGGTTSVFCYDATGRLVMHQCFNLNDMANPPLTLPLPPGLTGGVYMLQVNNGSRIYNAKFLKL